MLTVMNRILTSLLLVLATVLGYAQGTMNIHLISDTTIFYDLGGIDSAGYQLEPPPPSMLVHQTGGGVFTYLVTEIDSITYSPGGPEGTPQLATLPPVSVGDVFAICRVAVGSNGSSSVVDRGICYGTTELPDLGGLSVSVSSSTGPFQVGLVELQPGVTYFARAYAINSAGTAYGNQVQFTTAPPLFVNGPGVTDINGNNYSTIILGNGQEWMAENLRTNTYANGDTIPNVTGNPAWFQLTTGAWAHYQNNASYENPYGKLYNWYAVADPRNVCPTGWHVPTDAEWNTLVGYLDPAYVPGSFESQSGTAGGMMKSTGTQYWQAPNTGATNESGFSGLSGGTRGTSGGFSYLGNSGYWWSASEIGPENALDRYLYYGSADIFRNNPNKIDGLSVRCLRD
jgi:uncharacterized protein (TIGR02145 family)